MGAHVDSYDVFLLQAHGQRRWRISAQQDLRLRDDLPLKILRHFEPEQEFILNPGDMLYLPPGFAHNGIALGESITYSVGFRAPHQKEMLQSFVQFCSQIEGDEIFYTDQGMQGPREPGLILPSELQRLRELMLSALQDEKLFMRWIGGFLTEPRSFHEPLEKAVSEKSLLAGLKKGRAVERAEGARLAFYNVGEKLHFAAEGECFVLDPSLTELVTLLCREQSYSAEQLFVHSEKLGFMELLCHLWNQSYLRWAHEE